MSSNYQRSICSVYGWSEIERFVGDVNGVKTAL